MSSNKSKILLGTLLVTSASFFMFLNTTTVGCPSGSLASSLVKLGSSGKLLYSSYLNICETDQTKTNIVPDFSSAGYRKSEVKIPTLKERIRVPVAAGDSTARIQAAINEVSRRTPDANGHRGAVVLEKGFYRVDGTLKIAASGVVLRGQGQHPDGTNIVTGRKTQGTVIEVGGSQKINLDASSKTNVRDAYVGVGATNLFLTNNSGKYQVGDTIMITRTPNDQWIQDLDMDNITSYPGSDSTDKNWKASEYVISHEREIVYKNGGHIKINIPIVDAIDAKYGGGTITKVLSDERIQETGVEDLRIISSFVTEEDEDHAWNAVILKGVRNSWVRRVSTQNFAYTTVTANDSSFVTVEDCASLAPKSTLAGGRRYSFNINGGGVGILFQRNFSYRGRHSFVTGAWVRGPHVWVDSYVYKGHSDDGPHHRWATGLLFDNIQTTRIAVQNRGQQGTGHGWSGAQVMLWRTVASQDNTLQAAPGSMNWAVGAQGVFALGMDSPLRVYGIKQDATEAQPRSLFFQQLKDRKGESYVNAISNSLQRKGDTSRIIDLLTRAPAAGSDPTCASGIKSYDGSLCCPAACGSCGGEGCGLRPGGDANCCGGTIVASGKSCYEKSAPCNLTNIPAAGFKSVEADPTCSRGIQGGDICCAPGCGTCGGSSCGGRPGGAAACCGGVIADSKRSCAESEAPCVIPVGAK